MQNSNRSLRIFLCHSSADKPAVRELYQRLKADGFEPWLDEEDLMPGEDWQLEIPKAVKNSDVVIVCLSRGSVSKAGYVQKEIKFALDIADEQPENTIFIIPLRLDECEVPERLRRWQWVNSYESNAYSKLRRALGSRANSIRLGVETSSSAEPPKNQVEPSKAHDTSTATKVFGAVILAASMFFALLAVINNPRPAPGENTDYSTQSVPTLTQTLRSLARTLQSMSSATDSPTDKPLDVPAPRALGGFLSLGTHVVTQEEVSAYCIGRAYRVAPWAIAEANGIPFTKDFDINLRSYRGMALLIPAVPWYNIPPGPTCLPQFVAPAWPTPTPTQTSMPTSTPSVPTSGQCTWTEILFGTWKSKNNDYITFEPGGKGLNYPRGDRNNVTAFEWTCLENGIFTSNIGSEYRLVFPDNDSYIMNGDLWVRATLK
jgi:hypothetical protein